MGGEGWGFLSQPLRLCSVGTGDATTATADWPEAREEPAARWLRRGLPGTRQELRAAPGRSEGAEVTTTGWPADLAGGPKPSKPQLQVKDLLLSRQRDAVCPAVRLVVGSQERPACHPAQRWGPF